MNRSFDLGIDLGTTNVRIYQEGKGVILREPSVVAVDRTTGKVLQVGVDARNMLGRTPGNVAAIRPLHDGVISDYEMAEKLLTELLKKVRRFSIVKPRVVIAVPSGVTEVEERAVIQAAMEAGARRVFLIEEPLAAALGARMDFSGADGHMVVDIGGGTTDLAVLSLNNIVRSASTKTAGESFDQAIIRFVRRRYSVLIGENTAEEVKMTIGSVIDRPERLTTTVKGRDLKTGLPQEVILSTEDMVEALKRPVRQIVDEVLLLLERTEPELVADIGKNGILLTGGGSLIWGLDRLLTERTGIPCRVADDADACVVLGCGKSLRLLHNMQEGAINVARKRLLAEP